MDSWAEDDGGRVGVGSVTILYFVYTSLYTVQVNGKGRGGGGRG